MLRDHHTASYNNVPFYFLWTVVSFVKFYCLWAVLWKYCVATFCGPPSSQIIMPVLWASSSSSRPYTVPSHSNLLQSPLPASGMSHSFTLSEWIICSLLSERIISLWANHSFTSLWANHSFTWLWAAVATVTSQIAIAIVSTPSLVSGVLFFKNLTKKKARGFKWGKGLVALVVVEIVNLINLLDSKVSVQKIFWEPDLKFSRKAILKKYYLVLTNG